MSGENPNKNDIEIIFKKLRNIPTNKECFDCNAKNPTWSSVTYGVFICIDCSAVHRGLGVHLSFVRSTQLDTNWTWIQLRQMQLGGNANAISFFNQHNCNSKDAQQKYNSRAAQLYREKIQNAAIQAMKIHGTKLFLDAVHEPPAKKGGDQEEVDFFAEHSSEDNYGFEPSTTTTPHQASTPVSTITTSGFTSLAHPTSTNEVTGAPCVEKAFSEPLKTSSLGAKKIQHKKSGLGGKKLGKGLGAQKVKTNFAEIEKEAELADQLKIEITQKQSSLAAATSIAQENEDSIENISLRLAYQDISKQQKREEEKLKQHNPKKLEQMERLGMGFAPISRSGGVSHSVLNDSQDIQQEVPTNQKESKFGKSFSKNNKSSDLLDDWTLYNEGSSSEDDYYGRSKTSSVSNNSLGLSSVSKSSQDYSSKKSSSTTPATSTRSTFVSNTPPVSSGSTECQKKFGSAKSISSSQYFGDSNNGSNTQSDLSRFEGSSSISSADYFGHDNPYGNSSYVQGPDLDDVRESVRQGVTKVAGKLSSLANGVMSSIQEKYGGY